MAAIGRFRDWRTALPKFRLGLLAGVLAAASLAGLASVSASEVSPIPSSSVVCDLANDSIAVCLLETDQPVDNISTLVVTYLDSDGRQISEAIPNGAISASFACSGTGACYSFRFESSDPTLAAVTVSSVTWITDTAVLTADPADPDTDTETTSTTTTVTTTVPDDPEDRQDPPEDSNDPDESHGLGFPCPGRPDLTCAERPTENVVTLTVTSESVTVENSVDGSVSTHGWNLNARTPEEAEESEEAVEEFSQELIEVTTPPDDAPDPETDVPPDDAPDPETDVPPDDAPDPETDVPPDDAPEPPMVVINYPVTPNDPDQAWRYYQAESAASALGRPYMVCFPAEIRDTEGNVVVSYPDEDCIIVTPR